MGKKRLDDLKKAIKSDLQSVAPAPQFKEVVEALRAVAAGIGASLPVAGGSVTVEPGYRVNFGQQYNVILEIKPRKFRDTLFRAYVSPQGFVRENVGTRLATLA
jgi:hypothetical protein